MRAAVLVVLGVVAACSPIVDQRGILPQAEQTAAIRPGIHTRAEVQAILGTPTAVGTFDPNIWYYMGQRTETLAWFAPNTVEQRVLAIRFDGSGTVAEMTERGLEDRASVDMVARETPTAGHSLTFIEQLFGNVGRFTGDRNAPQPGTLGRVRR